MSKAISFVGSHGTGPGKPFTDNSAIPDDAVIRKVTVRWGRVIDSIQVFYETGTPPNRVIYAEPKNGGPKGSNQDEVELSSDDYIMKITGRTGAAVDSLRIYTDQHRDGFGKYGGNGGNNDFEVNLGEGNEIIGFWGREGVNEEDYVIVSIGAIFRSRT
jgi:jacalin-like lectin domain-containing protein